jgi:hypothetical protein
MLKGELSPGVRLSFGALTMGIVGRVGWELEIWRNDRLGDKGGIVPTVSLNFVNRSI